MSKVEKPQIKFSTNLLEFGYIVKGTTVQKSFFAENLSCEEVSWKIIELAYNFKEKCLQKIQTNSLSSTNGTLVKKGKKINVTYTVAAKVSYSNDY